MPRDCAIAAGVSSGCVRRWPRSLPVNTLSSRPRQDRQAGAAARLERAQAGESVIGRIRAGRIGWPRPGALGRAIARQQAKLDRRAAVIAAGRRPMGRPPVPPSDTLTWCAQRAVDAALAVQQSPPLTQPPPNPKAV